MKKKKIESGNISIRQSQLQVILSIKVQVKNNRIQVMNKYLEIKEKHTTVQVKSLWVSTKKIQAWNLM